MRAKDKNAMFGKYPSCDYLNNALRYLKLGNAEDAIREIVHAIKSADGYFHKDIAKWIEAEVE